MYRRREGRLNLVLGTENADFALGSMGMKEVKRHAPQ
jgi:hypothetical protein